MRQLGGPRTTDASEKKGRGDDARLFSRERRPRKASRIMTELSKATLLSITLLLTACSEDELATPETIPRMVPPTVTETAAPTCHDVAQLGGDAPVTAIADVVDFRPAEEIPPVEDGVYVLRSSTKYGEAGPSSIQRATIVVRGARWYAVVDDGAGTPESRWTYDVTTSGGYVTQATACSGGTSTSPSVKLRYTSSDAGFRLINQFASATVAVIAIYDRK